MAESTYLATIGGDYVLGLGIRGCFPVPVLKLEFLLLVPEPWGKAQSFLAPGQKDWLLC